MVYIKRTKGAVQSIYYVRKFLRFCDTPSPPPLYDFWYENPNIFVCRVRFLKPHLSSMKFYVINGRPLIEEKCTLTQSSIRKMYLWNIEES